MSYSSKLIDHYGVREMWGKWMRHDDSVGTGLVVVCCGDVLKLQIKVNTSTGVIEDVGLRHTGVGQQLLAQVLLQNGSKVKALTKQVDNTVSNCRRIASFKIHCSILAEDAIKAAIVTTELKCRSIYLVVFGSGKSTFGSHSIFIGITLQLSVQTIMLSVRRVVEIKLIVKYFRR